MMQPSKLANDRMRIPQRSPINKTFALPVITASTVVITSALVLAFFMRFLKHVAQSAHGPRWLGYITAKIFILASY